MRRCFAALVTLGTLLLVVESAHAQTAAPASAPAPLPALPSAPASAPSVIVTNQPPPPLDPSMTMVTVTGPNATVQCGSVRIGMQCPPPMELALPAPRPPAKSHWYGWQTLITDGASLALLTAAAGTKSGDATGSLVALSGLTYALGGPIVHWSHGNGLKGAASLGLRVGIPVVLAGLGYGLGTLAYGNENYGGAVFGALGFVLGFPAAIAIDAAAIAREDVPDEDEAATQAKLTPPRPMFQLRPDVQTSKSGAQLGVRGTW